MLTARRQCTPSPKTSSFVAFAPMRVSASRRAKRICLVATSYGGTSGSKTSTGTILKPKLFCQNGSHLKRFPERWICGTTAAAACNVHCNFSCCAAATPLIFKMHPLQRNTSQLELLSQAQRKMHLVISSLLHFTIERKVEIYSSASTVRAKIIPKHFIFSPFVNESFYVDTSATALPQPPAQSSSLTQYYHDVARAQIIETATGNTIRSILVKGKIFMVFEASMLGISVTDVYQRSTVIILPSLSSMAVLPSPIDR